jgi:hypothetical protein
MHGRRGMTFPDLRRELDLPLPQRAAAGAVIPSK